MQVLVAIILVQMDYLLKRLSVYWTKLCIDVFLRHTTAF